MSENITKKKGTLWCGKKLTKNFVLKCSKNGWNQFTRRIGQNRLSTTNWQILHQSGTNYVVSYEILKNVKILRNANEKQEKKQKRSTRNPQHTNSDWEVKWLRNITLKFIGLIYMTYIIKSTHRWMADKTIQKPHRTKIHTVYKFHFSRSDTQRYCKRAFFFSTSESFFQLLSYYSRVSSSHFNSTYLLHLKGTRV